MWTTSQYSREITEYGVEASKQMVRLVGKGRNTVFLESNQTEREVINKKLEAEWYK